MKKLSFVLVLLFGFGLTACDMMSKDLTRSKAEEILGKQNYGSVDGSIPTKIENSFQMADGAGNTPAYSLKAEQDYKEWVGACGVRFEKLKDMGFITYSIWKGAQGIRPPGTDRNKTSMVDYMYMFAQFSINPTDKLTPYITGTDYVGFAANDVSYKVKVLDIIFDKITGITKISDNEASVEFTVKPKFTPMNGLVDVPQNYTLQTARSSFFRRYDDGWRLIR